MKRSHADPAVATPMPRGARRVLYTTGSATVALGAVLTIAAVCGLYGGAADGVIPVSGQITVGRAPLKLDANSFGKVWFYPDVGKGNTCPHIPVGDIDRLGRYRLFTAGRDGAPPGWYRVMIVAARSGAGDKSKRRIWTKSLIHRRYGAIASSGLSVEVVEQSGSGLYDLRLK